MARRLAENPAVAVLLIEASSKAVPSIKCAGQWPANLGSERDWAFKAEPNPRIKGRSMLLNMGKALGGGSSIKLMIWSRGHKQDWKLFANEAGDPAWNYASVFEYYRRVEDWHGNPDPSHRGTGGIVFAQPALDPNPIATVLLEGARAAGIETFDSPNGRMMEGSGGCALIDVRIRDGQRLSVFRSYTYPYMDRPNLAVLTYALVTRVLFQGNRATGVEVVHGGNSNPKSSDAIGNRQ